RLHRIVQRPARRALAEHFERDTLHDVGQRAAVLDERLRRPRQHVDEAWRDGQPGRVDLHFASAFADVAAGADRTVGDGDIARARRGARAVVDGAAAQHHVVLGLVEGAAGDGQGHCDRDRAEGHRYRRGWMLVLGLVRSSWPTAALGSAVVARRRRLRPWRQGLYGDERRAANTRAGERERARTCTGVGSVPDADPFPYTCLVPQALAAGTGAGERVSNLWLGMDCGRELTR